MRATVVYGFTVTLALIPCCLARQTGFRLASGLPAARVSARDRGDAIQECSEAERSTDAFGRSERGELVGVGPLVEEVHEAAGRAREERAKLTSPSSRPARWARTLDQGQSSARATNPALTGFSAT